MDICVVGAGYVGLVTSACLAYFGNQVTAVESNPIRLESLKQGEIPFFEPGLSDFVKSCIALGTLKFTDNLDDGVKSSDVIFICVGTPPLANGESDLSQVMTVARGIGGALDNKRRRVIVNKSTVPVGSGNWVEMLVAQGVQSVQPVPARSSRTEAPAFSVVSNPEFLREGSAIADSFYPDRIVVGSTDEPSIDLMRKLYNPILTQDFEAPECAPRPKGLEHVPFVLTDLASAELIKYAANAFLAMKISFANEVAGLCEKVGADIKQVTRGIGLDMRIGSAFLNAGVGWGGSCFQKDILALMQVAREYHYPTHLLEATIKVNEHQRLVVIQKLQDELKIIKGRTVGLMGLSFKPNTDDLRDAPSLGIARQLIKMGALVKVYDPVSMDSCKKQHPDLDMQYCSDLVDLATGCDAIVLVTEWEEFKRANWREVSQVMRWPLVVDGRNVLQEDEMTGVGMTYRGVGR
ncbi:MAG: UDP-glucose/GDP-mannose dehydrogenase family protein [Candidatus Obscuribacterales bacterium]|nr:UDP-glucose/GDP-mannose dehydrogenase family protein [Candidatus Obscuribacterales bacterium]